MQTCFPRFPTTSLPLLRSLGNSTNLTVENGRDKCVHCAWEGRLAKFLFVHVRRKVSGIDGDGSGSGGGGGSFAAIELIGHLLFPAFFKEVNV